MSKKVPSSAPAAPPLATQDLIAGALLGFPAVAQLKAEKSSLGSAS